MGDKSLRARIRGVRRRLLWVGSASAVAWGLFAATALLLTAAWLDLLWELSPAWRIAMLSAAGAVGIAGVLVLAWRTARAGRSQTVARRLDETAGTGGAILTGLELDGVSPTRPVAAVSAGLARLAVDHAASLAGGIPAARAVPARPLGRAVGSLTGLFAAVGLLAVCLPGLTRTQWDRFTNPFADVPPFSRTVFHVTPGDVEVLYGSALEIQVAVRGEPVDEVELVLRRDGVPQETLPMFPEPGQRWRAALAKVTTPAVYHARSYRARSETYRIGVITVPRIEDVRLRITPPAYTNQNPYEGPLPTDGVAGLPGTSVRVWARSNRPLGGGTITVAGSGQPFEAQMKPTAVGSHEVVGQFEVACDGAFSLHVIDVDGQRSQQPFGGKITLLADERPFIRLVEPQPRSLATPSVALPVAAAAEDDYGISRVQLYRSLNDSRPLPADLPVAERPPRRVYERVYLPLAEYGLQPGDVIKLFGRVEDNDPAGAKGSESSVVTVEIVSQEDFERLLRLRRGLEVLMSKYREAQRRMEGLATEIEGLRKDLEGAPPEGRVAQETRERLQRLVRQLREESESIRKLAENRLPYDLDQSFAPQLETLARVPEEIAEELEKLLEQSDLHHEQLARQLEKLAGQLGSGRGQFGQTVMGPLEHLAAVFPLIADQSRFVMLVLRQMDLAERLAALKGHDGEDNPALKTRMRDLEQEQRQIRDELSTLLDDIEDHVTQLPEDPKFDRLRKTAAKFAKDVRASGALEAMAEAENALAEFSGTRGHQKAQEAAEILKKFLEMCEGGGGMGGCGIECLIFQPTLSKCLGNTVAQLLAEMGLPGLGAGTGGFGSGVGGFSAHRGGFGLYGGLPGMGEAFGGEYGNAPGPQVPPGGDFAAPSRGNNPDGIPWDETTAAGSSAAVGEGAVPVRYRRRVGQYFQRLAEELGDR